MPWQAIDTMSGAERNGHNAEDEPPTLSMESSSATYAAHEKEDESIVLREEHRIETSEDSITGKAKDSAKALKDLVLTLANKTKETAIVKTQEFKDAANDERPEFEKDAAYIQRLGTLVDGIAESFDDTMDTIRAAPYEEQVHLFQGFKKLLSEEVNVINARLSMASRLTFTNEQASRTSTESA